MIRLVGGWIMRILVVEDEKDLNNIIVKRLTVEKYSVDSCFDGEEVFDYTDMVDYDAIVLDIMLPKFNGLQVLKKLRENGNQTPVILLTAKGSVEDKVKGLNLGADDYLAKPFAFEELLARIRVMIRQRSNHVKGNLFQVADLIMDCNTHEVKRSGNVIQLSAKEFAILEYMIHNIGVVLSRERIEEHIWNYDYEGASNIVDVYIRYLRKKVDDGYSQKLIHTMRGVGYVLREEQ